MYAGETGKGWGLLAASVGTIVGGRFLGIMACDGYHQGGMPECGAGQVIAVTGAVLGLAVIIYQFIDAGNAARRHNETMESGASASSIPIILFSRTVF